MKKLITFYIIEKVTKNGKGVITLIYKVYYQESNTEVPTRENTVALFIEADSERDVRQKLKDRPISIEYIQPLEGAYLEYEKQREDFKVEK
jgi:DNA-dependent RNA polymerase auxiliary subunit epsilon